MRGRRTTVIAGVVMAGLVLLAFLFLVSPKRAQVSQAQTALEEAQAQNGTLRSQLGSLKQAEIEAPANRKLIRRVEQQLPPTADPQGFILLLKNAADKAGVDLTQQTIGAPVAGANGVTTIPITVSLTGTYFSLDEYLFQLETLPRAAKVSAISMAPAGTEGATTSAGRLTMQVTMELYTTDISAGPGSDPGPTVGTVPAPTG
ncbi:MAG: type 4a pilus biogenesis protein PilO [Actinomycetota bacterium]